MASSSQYDKELENKISEISTYLDGLLASGENHTNPNRTPILGMGAKTRQYNFIPSVASGSISHPLGNPFPIPRMDPMTMPRPCQLTHVTSALASRINAQSSHLRFPSPSYPRSRKWVNSKATEKEPDTSALDIDATMAELGLTMESLTSNEVYRLFSSFKKLAFYINSSYMFDEIYEARTLPNTMNASVQTKHAVWSSNRLLHHLRETLGKYSHVPAEYEIALSQCKQSLQELQTAILRLDTFKYCDLEHRKYKFVSPGAKEILNPMLKTLDEVIDCIGKSRMNVEVFIWSLNKLGTAAEEGAVGVSYGEPAHPVKAAESLEQTNRLRPMPARRFIG